MAIDIQKFFNELLPAAMLKNPEYFKEIDRKYIFKITGEGGGEWSVNASKSEQSVTQGDSGNVNCGITMSAEEFQKYYEKPDEFVTLYLSGKAVNGDMGAALNLPKLLKLGN